MAEQRNARIRERAYHLWQESGGEPGREVETWLNAEREIDAAAAQQPASPETAAKPSKRASKTPDATAAKGKTPAANPDVAEASTKPAAKKPAAAPGPKIVGAVEVGKSELGKSGKPAAGKASAKAPPRSRGPAA